MSIPYPFTAIIGQDDLKLALILVTIDPTIGGVLIRGERGTAKSTAARGLAALVPPGLGPTDPPFIELPLGATEDRIVGSLDVNAALRDGCPILRSGLLARAHGGILYIDEVNLLPDHLVDLLLDSAASGRVTIERDGISASEPARFILIGSMNPEEGELRPQFLDRFGLMVEVRAPTETNQRMANVRARLDFDADPTAFAQRHQPEQDALRQRIAAAREQLQHVRLADSCLSQAAALCAHMHIDGLRGDIVVAKTARALAAWEGASGVGDEHLRRAAQFALAHRRRRRPRDTLPSTPVPQPPAAEERLSTSTGQSPSPAASATRPAPPATSKPLDLHLPPLPETPRPGRRPSAHGPDGPALRPLSWSGSGPIALAPTVLAAAARGARLQQDRLVLQESDLRRLERRGRAAAHVLLIVDASGSMAGRQRLTLAKGVVRGLLDSSYQRRDDVGLMIVAGERAALRLPFTRQVERAEQALRDVPTGGRTPLAHALQLAGELCADKPSPLIVVLTDGRANVALSGGDPWHDALAAARKLGSLAPGALVIDCESGPIRLGRARDLADALGAQRLLLEEIDAEKLTVRLHQILDHP